ncbi:MAG: queuosine precursor transporter [Nanobdellota archaeon]
MKKTILSSLFIAGLIAANLLGNKITYLSIGDFTINFAVGIFAYPITFIITDIIHEVYGSKEAQKLIYSGMISIIFVLLLTIIAIHMPPADRFTYNESFKKIFGISARVLVGSFTAFAVSQMHDVWAFRLLKKKMKGKFLWLRNNISTIFSQFLDTTIFMFIAFYQTTPKFTAPFIFSLIIPYWILKIVVAAIDTPLVYLGVWWMKGKKKESS